MSCGTRHGYLCVSGEGGVPSHEVVESRGGDEGGNQTNQIIVHVAGITQGGGTGCHYCGNLKQLGYIYIRIVPSSGSHHTKCTVEAAEPGLGTFNYQSLKSLPNRKLKPS